MKKRQQDEMRREYIQEKCYQIVEMWVCEWWSRYRSEALVESQLRKNLPYRCPLNDERLMQGFIAGRLFRHLHGDIEVLEHLRDYFFNFPPIFKSTAVSRDDIGNVMKQYAENDNFMVQPRRMLISSFILTNGTIKTLLLLFFLQLGLVCEKNHRLVQYAPRKCFDNFVQSAVDARRQRDEIPYLSVVAETIKLLANSSYGYQIIDHSQLTVTTYLAV